VKVVNSTNSMIQVYFGTSVGFGADLAPGECNLVGIQLPSSYTLQTQVEISQCTPAAGGGCGALFGTTEYVTLTLPEGQTQTISVESNFFTSSGGGGGGNGTDATAPSTPTGLAATAVSASSISLTWTASTDNVAVTGYKIYRGSVYLKTVSGTSSSDTGLSASTNYCYTVSAIDAANNESAQSVQACATTTAGTSTASYTISGTVSGAIAAGVTINLTGSATTSMTTDASGNYTFTGLANGSYTVTPSLTCYTFTPISISKTINSANSNGNNFVSAASGSGCVPTAGLVAYYPFNGNTNDASGNGNDGIVSGATLTTDRFGNTNNAYAFNGMNSYIEVVTQSLKLLSRSVAFWIKTNQIAPAMYIAYENGSASYGWDLYSDTYALQCSLVSSTGGTQATANSAAMVADNSWNFIVGTDDGILLRLYVNGTLVSSVVSTNPIWSTNMNLYMGASRPENAGNMWFDGALDDVRIYNRALSSTEIQQLYNEGGYVATKAQSWDMVTEFSIVNNPSGQWSYGRKWAIGDSTLDVSNQLYGGTMWWFGNYGNGWPALFTWGAWVNMWAGNNTNGYPTIRWTCPKSGYYTMTGAFIGYDSRAQGVGNNVYVIVNGATSSTAHLQMYLEKNLISLGRSYYNQNDYIDFLNIWDGIAYYGYGVVGASARITETQ
jgi:chitodextrinase